MVLSDDNCFEEETRRLLAEATSELAVVNSEMDELTKKRALLVNEIESYRAALDGFLKRTGRPPASYVDWGELLENKTHKDRLVAIAEQRGGKLRISEAIGILHSPKFTTARKRETVRSMIQNYMDRLEEDGVMVKTGSGEYSLAGFESPPLKPRSAPCS